MANEREIRDGSFNVMGFEAGLNSYGQDHPITITAGYDKKFPYVFSTSHVRDIAAQLVALADRADEEASRITIDDIVDGAVFWADGYFWRKLVEVPDGLFVIVTKDGAPAHGGLKTKAQILALANRDGYSTQERK